MENFQKSGGSKIKVMDCFRVKLAEPSSNEVVKTELILSIDQRINHSFSYA